MYYLQAWQLCGVNPEFGEYQLKEAPAVSDVNILQLAIDAAKHTDCIPFITSLCYMLHVFRCMEGNRLLQ